MGVTNVVEMQPMLGESHVMKKVAGGGHVLDHTLYDEIDKVLKMPAGGMMAPRAPMSTTDGEVFGWMMHQGKYRGAWKKAYFVLKSPFLFQYTSDKATAPKKAFYVSYVMTEKMAAEALAEETSAKYMMKLEEKACSLRINIYSPDKVKILTAPSEKTMNNWVDMLEKSVSDSCAARPGLHEEKTKAAEAMKPLMMAQVFQEHERYNALTLNMQQMGMLPEDDDPRGRRSDEIGKCGKMKMLKSGMDETVWQKFYFVLVDTTIYYYKSRKSGKANYDDKDDEDDEEDEEDENDMPWKGCFNVTVATVNQAPANISTKAKVFQVKTPLRTFIMKARHEIDAEEWMAHICAAQQGVPIDEREAVLRGFDVYNDKLASKLTGNPTSVTLEDILKHPVGIRYFMQYLQPQDPSLAKMVKAFKSIEKYKRKVVPAKKHKKALKIFKKFVKGNEHIPKGLQNEIASAVEQFDFLAQNMFSGLVDQLTSLYESQVADFKRSPIFQQMVATTGPKMLTVSREKGADFNIKLDGDVYVGRSRENESGSGYVHLEDDHKVSREHCRFDAGTLAVMVTDLGSSKGSRLGAKDGKKIINKIIMPGQSIFIGSYVLTYHLGVAQNTGKKKGAGMMGGLFGKKKK